MAAEPRHGRKFCVSDIRQSQEWRCGNRAESGEHPLPHPAPGRVPQYARRGLECCGVLAGKLRTGDQLATLCGNTSSSWLSTRSQFWQRARQCFMILCEAKYNIRRRESLLVKDGLFFVICRNWRFKPSMIFVVYMVFQISSGYSKKVLRTSRFFPQLFTQEGY